MVRSVPRRKEPVNDALGELLMGSSISGFAAVGGGGQGFAGNTRHRVGLYGYP